MGHVNLTYNLVQVVVVVPGKFNIAFNSLRKEKKEKGIVIMRPMIFINIEIWEKKKLSLVSFNFWLEFVCVYEGWRKKMIIGVINASQIKCLCLGSLSF